MAIVKAPIPKRTPDICNQVFPTFFHPPFLRYCPKEVFPFWRGLSTILNCLNSYFPEARCHLNVKSVKFKNYWITEVMFVYFLEFFKREIAWFRFANRNRKPLLSFFQKSMKIENICILQQRTMYRVNFSVSDNIFLFLRQVASEDQVFPRQ